MKIIIVGGGKVGTSLVAQLAGEAHNIVVVDTNEDSINRITNRYDAMGILGNGVSYTTLQEAGVKSADLLIAVTGSDEQNLLCCLIAKKAGHCKTIARVSNPIYYDEISFLKREFDLELIINPEYTAASEMARVLQFPSAIKIDSFVRGGVELFHFHINEGSPLAGMSMSEIRNNMKSRILFCTVRREDDVFIPNGAFVLQSGDTVGIVGSRADAIAFYKHLGLLANRANSVMIAGGGRISYYLAERLLRSGIETTIVEMDYDRCEELTTLLPQATILHGNVADQRLLEEEGLHNYEGFAALTGLDEENIMISLYAKSNSNAKVITKINRINFASVINSLQLDTIVNPQLLTADYILRCIRSMNNSPNSEVENLYQLEDGRAEALEFRIKEASAVTGKPLQELKLQKNTLICSIYRNGKNIVPSGQDTIEVGDSVIVVLAGRHISDIKEILR
ncbi:MAG: Trk system potassium transporter TrkA [Lachnospiraceae bacterium]|nr:Trk system potassium transporter TrkA [Lachnospiraceae bacterium]